MEYSRSLVFQEYEWQVLLPFLCWTDLGEEGKDSYFFFRKYRTVLVKSRVVILRNKWFPVLFFIVQPEPSLKTSTRSFSKFIKYVFQILAWIVEIYKNIIAVLSWFMVFSEFLPFLNKINPCKGNSFCRFWNKFWFCFYRFWNWNYFLLYFKFDYFSVISVFVDFLNFWFKRG